VFFEHIELPDRGRARYWTKGLSARTPTEWSGHEAVTLFIASTRITTLMITCSSVPDFQLELVAGYSKPILG